MNDDERLEQLVRSALPPMAALGPTRDLWPLLLGRSQARITWSWLDVGLAATLAGVLLVFPRLLLILAYHL
jgi:hypothetical protein